MAAGSLIIGVIAWATGFGTAAKWIWVRGLAVLVAATPCPLILAAPVAFITGVSQAARNGILIKGGGPLEALARTCTVFDKTGTLTGGGARLIAIEAAPGEEPEEILRLAGSLEQASHRVVAATLVEATLARGASTSGLTLIEVILYDERLRLGPGIAAIALCNSSFDKCADPSSITSSDVSLCCVSGAN